MSAKRAPVYVLLANVVAIAMALWIAQQGGRDPFGERGFITFLSTFQLLAIAWVTNHIRRFKACHGAELKLSAVGADKVTNHIRRFKACHGSPAARIRF